MDPQLIIKILKFSAPESNASGTTDTEHPLLEPASCRLLSSGLVRLLRVSSAGAPRARTALLRNIRSLTTHKHSHCQSTHLRQLIIEYYQQLACNNDNHGCEGHLQDLSVFLSAQLYSIRLERTVDSTAVCLARALLNLNPENLYLERITQQFLTSDGSERAVERFLQEVWARDIFTREQLVNQLSLKSKPETERILLEASCNIVSEAGNNCVEVSETKAIKDILNKSSKSRIYFQMCCKILNRLFIISIYNIKLLTFIQIFVQNVRHRASKNFINLYDDDLQSLVIIMSCGEALSEEDETAIDLVPLLKVLRTKSKEKIIMLISHYSNWFEFCVKHNVL